MWKAYPKLLTYTQREEQHDIKTLTWGNSYSFKGTSSLITPRLFGSKGDTYSGTVNLGCYEERCIIYANYKYGEHSDLLFDREISNTKEQNSESFSMEIICISVEKIGIYLQWQNQS